MSDMVADIDFVEALHDEIAQAKNLGIRALARRAHETATEKGWWDETHAEGTDAYECGHVHAVRNVGEQLALFHSEVSEALEEWRDGHDLTEVYHTFKSRPGFDHDTSSDVHGVLWVLHPNGKSEVLTAESADRLGFDAKPEGFPIELADILIRVFDTAVAYGIDLEAALLEKMKYNEGRPYRHGGKRA